MKYLSIKEMHIEVEQQLQRENSAARDDLHPQQIDLALNKSQDRVVADAVTLDRGEDASYSIDTKKLSDIQPLIERTELPVVQLSDDEFYAKLPGDFQYALRGETKSVNKKCPNSIIDTFEYKYELNLNAISSTSPFFRTVSLEKDLTPIYRLGSNARSFEGFSSYEERFYVERDLLHAINAMDDMEGYIEDNILTIYSSSSFDLSLKVGSLQYSLTRTQNNYKRAVIPTEASYRRGIARIYKEQFAHSYLSNSLHMTTPRSILSSLSNDRIYFYDLESILVGEFKLVYIRKPRIMDIYLNNSCQLGASAHHKIVDWAVEYIKNIIRDESYPAKVQDNELRVE